MQVFICLFQDRDLKDFFRLGFKLFKIQKNLKNALQKALQISIKQGEIIKRNHLNLSATLII